MISALGRFIQNPSKFYRESIYPRIVRRYPALKYGRKLTDVEAEFCKKLSRYKINWTNDRKTVVLMQLVEDHAFTLKLSATANYLAKKHNSNIGLYHAETRIERPDYPSKKQTTAGFTEFLAKMYLHVGGKILHYNTDVFDDNTLVENQFKQIKKQLITKYDVLQIHIEGVLIGDLLNDAYLRFANKTEVNIHDPFFDELLKQAIHIYFNSKQTLDTYNIVALVNSYTTYTKHGIIARLCLKRNIPVYIPLCGFISLVHRVLPSFPTHRNNHFSYRDIFNSLEGKNAILSKYKSIFEKRFEGVIDGATYYMKQSAFSGDDNPELNNVDWNNTVVILAHCFFDSPHIYRDLLFPDFYEWMVFTLNELVKQPHLTILVKQHPNGLPQNAAIFDELKLKYKNNNIKFIDKKTSQSQILRCKPKAILTAYGTAAAEFAYHNFPVLTIYDNPFTAFNFTHVADSIEDYKDKLSNILTLPSKGNKDEIIEYYYMHNYFFLKGRDPDYLGLNKIKHDSFSNEFLSELNPQLNDNYFTKLDESIADGMNLIDLEDKLCNNNYIS